MPFDIDGFTLRGQHSFKNFVTMRPAPFCRTPIRQEDAEGTYLSMLGA